MSLNGNSGGGLNVSLRRGDWFVLSLLGVVIALSWLYLLSGAGLGMDTVMMSSAEFPPPRMMSHHHEMTWGAEYSALVFVMWWLMMVAMMLPSAAPLVLIYNRMYQARGKGAAAPAAMGSTWLFVAGYILAWGGFSFCATLLQAVLEDLHLVHPMMMWSLSKTLTALLLILAGVYQWTPLKEKCLKNCRSPIDFLTRNWRKGRWGPLWMGVHHGIYCLGCCWFLMGLLFAGGVMNLFWITGLAVFVLIEKVIPAGQWFGRLAGLGMATWGVWMLI
ncbi:MAG: DUF2182 domain-containing protein [Alphaproteobacteria bacterium]